ncbi:hypothetical protein GGTG_13493 [Gaeumannomyces tritici R3-111a-1]|uniref:Secreted protein n=1 Tax=Gaeumannomyces tritici (strain R3-111a-1) TaxID=644352 RepID=J3PJ11_GAET3|nr:hypothetical protein GGTG_13493 [Gaeumannomyces tritici R3-111a-1]EJT68987.1 hypothetical protein GGTG_13493 [Gaeumannomyces tritici R3-111a-1]
MPPRRACVAPISPLFAPFLVQILRWAFLLQAKGWDEGDPGAITVEVVRTASASAAAPAAVGRRLLRRERR